MFIGTRYIMRAQERLRRRRVVLFDDKDDDKSGTDASSLSNMQQIVDVDVGSSNLRIATASLRDTLVSPRVIKSAYGLRATSAAVAVDNGNISVGAHCQIITGSKTWLHCNSHTSVAWLYNREERAEEID